ncbi:putative mediator of RNA polymerase II transcription subunit 26 isoform X2 [Eupeodes corollae]|uniref:putative mediator of RNA polymerase II transcription subunit 26 isoform X2 n=1 Tax=Eupeodes corollae TaxID=290404 RepID=UPI002492FEA7|nr:putative mediator of RNA polymerase II transcription subunit 26 isoform X2 [Eupeodes corollae]
MGAKAKVFCGLMLFVIVFGLRFFCANCQRYPPQQQQQQQLQQHQIQMQNFQQHHLPLQLQQHQLHAVTVPLQKDLHSNENRLQSQMLRTGVSLVVQGNTAADVGGQREYYNPNWSNLDTSNKEQYQQEAPQQQLNMKNCKRKRRPQAVIYSSTTDPPVLSPLQQYWRGHVEDELPRGRQKIQQFQALPTQMSERLQEPSTTKLSERIGEAFSTSSRSSEIIEDPLPTKQHTNMYSSQYPDIRRPSPTSTIFSEKIREFNPTKESLIQRQPITSTIFDKFQDPSPTRILERNREIYSTKPDEQMLQDPSPTRFLEKNRESYSTKPTENVIPEAAAVVPSRMTERVRDGAANSKKAQTAAATDRNREQFSSRNSEKIREPLAALEKEQKLSEERDKQRQQVSEEKSTTNRDKSYRRPYSQAKKDHQHQQAYPSREESSESKSPKPRSQIDLKEILKNSGGLSLSEILQQKNLSLDDLLKGKQNALLALQTTAAAPEKQMENQNLSKERFGKPSRKIPSLGLHSLTTTTSTSKTTTTDTNLIDQSVEEQSSQSGESQEILSEEQTSNESKATKIPATLRKNLKFPSRIRMSPSTTRRQQHFETTLQQRFSTTTTTSTTPKPSTTRIPLYKKRQNTRLPLGRIPNFKKPDPTTGTGVESFESSPSRETSESREDNSTVKRSRTRQPSSSSSTTTTSTTTEATSDLTDPASNFVDYSSGENEVLQEFDTSENASTSMSRNNSLVPLNDNREKSKTKNLEEPVTDHIYRYNSLKNYIDNNLPHAVLMDIDLADIDPVDDRTDLLELIEDRRSGNRLIKVLEQRNMTLEELIEHRKRGSSQLHLATFVQNRSGVFPGKKVVVNDDMDIVTAFENFPHFNLLNLKSVKPDEIKTDSQGSSYFTSIIDIEPTDDSSKEQSRDTTAGKSSIRSTNFA